LIGKLIILGIIIVTAIILVPSLTKNPSLHSLEVTADKALSNSNAQKNQTLVDIKPVNLNQLDPKYVNKQTFVGQVFDKSDGTCKISVPGLADTINNKTELTHILDVQNCPYKIGDPVLISKLEPKENIPVPVSQPSSITVDPYSIPSGSGNTNSINSDTFAAPVYYNTIQLTASNQGNDVTINYDDTSGKTIDVTVTLRNSEKEIFSGKFISSQFQTLINDVPNTPHIIDMTVDSSAYGTLHASVYAPANNQNSIISGIFTKP
jgi:hypothetical protein